jgi:peptidoglycan hydrolase-like protein with peptidoglycan-binding domain
MAQTDLPNLSKYKGAIEAAAARHGLPPALLAAIASRESRAGAALDSRGRGDGGNGFGLMQVDFRYHTPRGGPYSADHIDQAAGILKGMLNQVKSDHPDWSPEQQLRGAVAAYNSGTDNVRTLAGMDRGTTGDDYSNDVWARAQALAPHFGGTAGTTTPSPGTTTPGSGTTTPGSGTTTPGSGSLLRAGSGGAEVTSLQNDLKKLGFDAGKADGIFGPNTEKAVKAFQARNNLEADGIVGPKTREAMQKALAAKAHQTQQNTDTFETGSRTWKPAPSLDDVKAGKAQLQEGMQGAAVKKMQELLGVDADGKFGQATKQAVVDFQKSAGLKPAEGTVGKTTMEALEKAGSTGSTGGVIGNGLRIDTNNPILKKLATSHLNDGPTGYCVLTTLNNMHRLGIPNTPEATGMDPNNPRGGMAQMLRNGWESIPFPGSRQQAIRSPYGNATANVVSADQYRKLVAEGKVPDGAIIFQTRHGWNYSGGSSGNDMGVVRNNGRTTHNYQDMNSIIYRDCKDVVILVPKGAIQRE